MGKSDPNTGCHYDSHSPYFSGFLRGFEKSGDLLITLTSEKLKSRLSEESPDVRTSLYKYSEVRE